MYQCVNCRLVKRQCDRGVPCSRCDLKGIGEKCCYTPRRSSGKMKYTSNTPPQSVPEQTRDQLCIMCRGKLPVVEYVSLLIVLYWKVHCLDQSRVPTSLPSLTIFQFNPITHSAGTKRNTFPTCNCHWVLVSRWCTHKMTI